MKERDCWLGFSNFKGVGPVTFAKLLKYFRSAQNAWNAPGSNLDKILGKKLSIEFEDFQNSFSFSDYEKRLKKNKVWFLTLQDNEYPKLLKQIKRPPFVLYGKGLSPSSFAIPRSIAVVGTRKITEYGREVTKLFTSELVGNGFTIVSGLAMGVDAVAHTEALENNGKTIAVLGCGVDCCSPEENSMLYNQILQKDGVIVSEFPLGHPPSKGSFPARNRIIAGLSQGVLVTEGAEDSGSLITADYSFTFNRPVFAVPGPITSSLSKGPYKLINKGAKLVTSAEEIIKELNFQFSNSNFQSNSKSQISKLKGDTKEEDLILKLLENEAMHFDQIGRKTQIPSQKLGSILSVMEMKGMIKSGNGTFSL